MKKIILILTIALSLNANINIKQNIKALYRGVNLTDTQEEYILDSQDKNINIIKKELSKKKFKNIREKLVISFLIDKNKNISKFKYLKKSDDRKIDKYTKSSIKRIASKLITPSEKTELRYIIDYNFQKKLTYANNYQSGNINNSKKKYDSSIKYIEKGTTRLKHSSKEYVFQFETSKDGFVNFNTNPTMCNKKVTLLTDQNQRIRTGYSSWQFNTEIKKGKYKLLVQTKQDCDISIQYP